MLGIYAKLPNGKTCDGKDSGTEQSDCGPGQYTVALLARVKGRNDLFQTGVQGGGVLTDAQDLLPDLGS